MRHLARAFCLLALLLLCLAAASEPSADKPEPPFHGNLDALARSNTDYRRVLFTGKQLQLVAMSLLAGEDIGEEVHEVDQCFFFVAGRGEARLEGEAVAFEAGDSICVPAGVRHDIASTGESPLKLYTLYAPPEHPAGTVQPKKPEPKQK